MRLDKFVAEAADLTRSQSKQALSQKRVSVDGAIVSDAKFKVLQEQTVRLDGQLVVIQNPQYIALNKPLGYICSTLDEVHPSALQLIKGLKTSQLHFAGRLDLDTTGLVLISDDGQWTHKITSPKRQCRKVYRVVCAERITPKQITALEQGVLLDGETKPTQAASVSQLSEKSLLLGLSEGKYHQVKRMLAAVGNHVSQLHRESIGSINLHELAEGDWRYLTLEEIASFR